MNHDTRFLMFLTFILIAASFACASSSTNLSATDVTKDQTNAKLALSIYNDVTDGGSVMTKIKAHAIFCNEQGELIRAKQPTIDGGPACK